MGTRTSIPGQQSAVQSVDLDISAENFPAAVSGWRQFQMITPIITWRHVQTGDSEKTAPNSGVPQGLWVIVTLLEPSEPSRR